MTGRSDHKDVEIKQEPTWCDNSSPPFLPVVDVKPDLNNVDKRCDAAGAVNGTPWTENGGSCDQQDELASESDTSTTQFVRKRKKHRASNFSINEKNLLAHLTLKYKNIIQNKSSSATTWRDKSAGWDRLCAEFNARSGEFPRSAEMLRNKFHQLKGQARQKKGVIAYRERTVPPPSARDPHLTPAEEIICAVIGIDSAAEPPEVDSDVIDERTQSPCSPASPLGFLEDFLDAFPPKRDGSENAATATPLAPKPPDPDLKKLHEKSRELRTCLPKHDDNDVRRQPCESQWVTHRNHLDHRDDLTAKYLKAGDRDEESRERIDLLRKDIESKIEYRKIKAEMLKKKVEAEVRLIELQILKMEGKD